MREENAICHSQENNHVSPRPIIAMDRNGVNRLSEFESTTSQSAGSVELWDGHRQIVWHDVGVCGAGLTIRLFGSQLSATLAGMVLWSQRQKRGQTPGIGCENLFCALVEVDSRVVACR
jgi:hypothetical protein